MILLHATGRDGILRQVESGNSSTLMEALRAEPALDIAASCGGSCVCATCHIYVAPDWQNRLPPADALEQELLAQLLFADTRSRLSCQIRLLNILDGLKVTVAPEE